MEIIKCSQCGREIESDSKFCSYCGNRNSFAGYDDVEINRDFLLANIQDIMKLHYITRNYGENIDALKERLNSTHEIKTEEPPKPPIKPNNHNKDSGGYENYDVITTVGEIIGTDIFIMIFGFILWPIAILVALGVTIKEIITNKKIPAHNQEVYQRNLVEYKRRLEDYNKTVERNNKTNIEINTIAKPNLTKAINSLGAENREALKLLDECYSLNIIPSKYRNIYAITFIYDYLSTSQGTLRDALFACDLDKIQSQLEKVIQNQASMICKLAKIEANSEKQLKQQEKMINHLEKIEKNTYDTARASEQCAQYNKIIAHNTKVMAYCSAMTYIETNDIANYDPYSPGTIRDFGLSRFRSYYKD